MSLSPESLVGGDRRPRSGFSLASAFWSKFMKSVRESGGQEGPPASLWPPALEGRSGGCAFGNCHFVREQSLCAQGGLHDGSMSFPEEAPEAKCPPSGEVFVSSYACLFFSFLFFGGGLPVPPNSHQLNDCLLSLPARLALVTHVWARPCVILHDGNLEISIISL